MTISIGYHFATIPEITHRDFHGDRPFTAATLTDENGIEHHIYLPLGARVTVEQKEHSHE